MKALIRWNGDDDSYRCTCCIFDDAKLEMVQSWILSTREQSLERAKRRVDEGKPYYPPDTYSIEDDVYSSFEEWLNS